MHLSQDVLTALEKAATEEEKARSKGAARKDKTDRAPETTPSRKSDDASGAGTSCD
jgi:hypothetical protein